MAKFKYIRNTGFSSKSEIEGARLINKDGSFNVKKTGLSFWQRFSIFHWLTNTNWLAFFSTLLLTYLILNFLFAIVYVMFGIEGLSGDIPEGSWNKLMKAFYFSTQTMTTLGYGAVSPVGTAHNIIASLESFFGLLGFATSTGLLYSRFSKPKVNMLFSKNALVSPYRDNEIGLMMRMANAKDSQLINAKARMIISWVDSESKDRRRHFYNLDLELNEIGLMVSSWTLVHPIGADSPIIDLTQKEFVENDGELIVTVNAYDETYAHEVHVRTSYKAEEVIWGAKFERILIQHPGKTSEVDISKLSSYKKT